MNLGSIFRLNLVQMNPGLGQNSGYIRHSKYDTYFKKLKKKPLETSLDRKLKPLTKYFLFCICAAVTLLIFYNLSFETRLGRCVASDL